MEELYRKMYLKYAPHLSEGEINEKVSYATTQDSTSFANSFYQKYTGSGPSKQQSKYISNYTQESQTKSEDIEQPKSFLSKMRDSAVNAVDYNVAGLLNTFEQGQGALNDIYQQIEESGSYDPRKWKELTGEQKELNRQTVRQEGFDIGLWNLRTSKEMEDRVAKFEANQTRYNNDISAEVLKGVNADWGQVAERTILAGIGSWTSYLAMLSPRALLVLGSSTMGNKWDEEFDKDPDRANWLLLANAAGTGAIEFGEGMITRKLIGIPFIKAIRNGTASGSAVTAAKNMVMNGSVLALKRLGIAMGQEGGMEMAQALATTLWDKATLGYLGDNVLGYSPGDDRYDTRLGTMKKWYEIFDEGIVGAFMGGNVNIATQGIEALQGNTAQRRAEVLLRPKSDQDFINKKYKELSELHKESQSPDITPDVLERTRNKINELSNEILVKQSQSQKIVKTLRGDALMEYAANVDKINKANKAIDKSNKIGGEITQNNISKLNQDDKDEAIKRNEEIWKDHIHKSLNKNLNITDAYAKAASMEQVVVENEDEYQEIYENTEQGKKQKAVDGYAENVRGSDGFFDGSGKWYINKNQALKTEAVSVGSHELLHGIMKSTLRDSEGVMTKEGKALIQSFRNTLSAKESRIINRRVDTNYKYKRDNKGNLLKDAEGKIIENDFEEYGEEYLNAFSDAVQKNQIRYNEGVFTKLIDVFQSLFRSKGLNKNFKDGIDVYNFLKTYDKSIQTGQVDEDIVGMLKEGAKGRATVIQKSQTGDLMTDINALVEPNLTKEGFMNSGYLDAYSAITETDLLNGLIGKGIGDPIHGRTKNEFIEEVKSRLGLKMYREFDPTKNNLFGWLAGKKNMIEFVKGDVNNAWKPKTEKPIKSLDTTIEGKEGSKMAQQTPDTAPNPEEALIAKEEAAAALVIQEDNLRKELGIKEDSDLYNEILDANEAALSGVIDIDKIRSSIESTFVNKLTDKLVTLMGKGKKYEKFIDEHGQAIIRKIPLRSLVEIERLIPRNERIFTKVVKENMIPSEIRAHEKKYGHSENLYYESETQGPTLYKKLDPTPEQIKGFLLVPLKIKSKKTGKEVRSGLRGNRKTKFASLGAIELGFDGTMQVVEALESGRSSETLKANKKLLQREQAELTKQIQRDPGVQLSVSTYQQLSDITMDMENPYDMFLDDFKTIKKSILDTIKNLHKPTVDRWLDDFIDLLDKSQGSVAYLGAEVVSYLESKGITTAAAFEKESEQLVIDILKKFGITVLHDKPTNVDGHPDIKIEIRGNTINIEIKKGPYDSQGASINGSIDWNTGELIFGKENNTQYLKDANVKKLIKAANKNITKAKTKIVKLMRISYPHLPKPGDKNFTNNLIPEDIYNEVFKGKNGQGVTLAQFKGNEKFMTKVNNNKKQPVYIIEYFGYGMFGMNAKHIGGKIGNQTLPELKADVLYKLRMNGNTDSRKVKGKKIYSYVTNKRTGKQEKQKNIGFRIMGTIVKMKETSNVSLLNKSQVLSFSKSANSALPAIASNNNITLSKSTTIEESIRKLKNMDKALKMARRKNPPKKGASFIDFDDTLATTDSRVIVNAPHYGPGKTTETSMKLTPAEFAEDYERLERQGAAFDFSEFSEVKNGKIGPFFDKAKALKDKFGNSDIYIITARPASAAPAIQNFLKGVGLDIKLENIIGLENGTSIAKAEVIIEKAAEGYNDFLFADDQIQNVKAVKKVLDILDVKGKTYQAKVQFSNTLNENFNYILEEAQGIDPNESISAAAAKVQGAIKNKFQFFIPPSAEDFVGLLYNFIGEGKQGETHLKFLENALVKPFASAYRMLNATKQAISVDFKGLKNKHKGVWGYMNKDSGYKNFTYGDAVRVFLWNRAGHNIPGMDQGDIDALVNIVEEFGDLTSFSNDLELITRLDSYPAPTEYWTTGNITADLYYAAQNVHRKQYLQDWVANKNEIFNPDNMNKIEALYGSNFREALEDMLWRMETGTNRKFGKNRQVNRWLNWVNNSVGTIMFINIRSAMLQTISMVNFVNWTDNNPAKAAAAFANQPQFWKDFTMIFNSDTLKQRRAGLQTDVNQAEMANAVARGQGGFNAAVSYLLKIGFTPTQIADSFAIATGGATFYRNRMDTYLKQGMSQEEAHKIAFAEFLEISEKTQQSARPDLISQQQAGPLGRLILAFQNTPMQYMRLTKKAVLDLKNGRGDVKTNISKIVYYTTVQNIIFAGLQSALFLAMGFSDDEEVIEEKKIRALNTGLDSVLRGMGIAGAVVATVKNILLQFKKQEAKGWSGDHGRTILEAANISPPIGSKLRKMYNSMISYKFNKDEIHQMGFDLDNPGILGVGNLISAAFNIPLDRAVMLINNARATADSRNATWQRIATALGFNTWDVGIKKNLPKVKKSRKKSRKKKKR